MTQNHSPTPYRYENDGNSRDRILDAHENVVVEQIGHLDGPFIVSACNTHDQLFVALEKSESWVRLLSDPRNTAYNEALLREDLLIIQIALAAAKAGAA